MKKRLLSLLLASVMVVSAAVPVFATEGDALIEEAEQEMVESSNADWNFEEATGTLTCYASAVGRADERKNICEDFEIKKVILTNSVKSIKSRAFADCKNLESIEMSDSLGIIETQAFANCSRLKTVTIPNKVAEIKERVFLGCTSLETVVLPEGFTTIGGYAFQGCVSLKNVNMPSTLAKINDSAFRSCSSLETIAIPKNVKSIGMDAFYQCTSLKSIELPEGLTTIGYAAFCSCDKLESITIPSTVSSLGGTAFSMCKLLKRIDNKSTCEINLPQVSNGGAFNYYKWYNEADTLNAITKLANGVAVREDYSGLKKPTEAPAKNSYKIVFYGNGATSGEMDTMVCKRNKKCKLTANKFKKDNYTFTGWNTKKNGKGKSYKNKQQIKNLAKANGTVKLYAQWKVNKYKVKLVYKAKENGHVVTRTKVVECKCGKEYSLPTIKTKGFVTKKWSTKKNGKGKVYKCGEKFTNLTSKKGKTVTLYAVQKKR